MNAGAEPPTRNTEAESPIGDSGVDPPTRNAGAESPIGDAGVELTIVDAEVDPPTKNAGADSHIGDSGEEPPIGDTGAEPPIGDSGVEPPIGDTGVEPPIGDSGAAPPTGDTRVEPPIVDAGVDPPTENAGPEPPIGDAGVDPPTRNAGEEPPTGNSRSVPIPRNRAMSANGDNTVYLLSDGWRQSLPRHDHEWVSNKFFKRSTRGMAEFDMSKITQLWFYPPEPETTQDQPPKPGRYFATRLCLWMPRKLWRVKLVCPREECKGQDLTSAGIYPTVRQVLDVDRFYNLAGEYLECRRCKRKIISWNKDILDQLDTGYRMQFQVVLTYRFACDMSIVAMMRARSRGNSPLQMMRHLRETHSGAWLRKTALYLYDVEKFIAVGKRDLVDYPQCTPPPAMPSLPTYRWLLGVYCNDVMERISVMRGSITSVFGRILKIDSTKKITKKLAGKAAGIAAWATNVGNEHGQVLMSVLTGAEGEDLHRMTQGIVRRYEEAGQPHPELLYVVGGCCGSESKLFREWPDVPVRLDIWNFMTRLGRGCTSKQHELYRFFLRRLSACIFAWSAEDIEKLVKAKRAELARKHITGLSEDDIIKRIGREEMSKHCRRATRGTEETIRLIGDLLAALDGDEGLDSHSVPLFDSDKIWQIWKSEKKHVACIQDPPGVALYTKTGETVKGGITLPEYRCARGSTSLESFHLHLNRFIPGTSANNAHFQAYLLEGVHRWNCDHATDAEAPGTFHDFDLNRLTEKFFAGKIHPTLTAPHEYTGEHIGLEYLLHQTNQELLPMQPDEGEVEGDDDSEESEDVRHHTGEDLEDPTQPPPEFAVSPASSRRSSTVSSQQPVAQPGSTKRWTPRSKRSSSLPGSSTSCRPHISKVPAAVSRATESPPRTSSGSWRTSRAQATVTRAPDSQRPTSSGTRRTSGAPATVIRAPDSPSLTSSGARRTSGAPATIIWALDSPSSTSSGTRRTSGAPATIIWAPDSPSSTSSETRRTSGAPATIIWAPDSPSSTSSGTRRTSGAPATVTRAADSPRPTSSGKRRTSGAPATVSRAPDSPRPTSSGKRRTSGAPATVSRALDSPNSTSSGIRRTSGAPATVSRAPDSPSSTSSGKRRTSGAPATVTRAPDSPTVTCDTLEGGTLGGDEGVNEDVDLREESDEEYTGPQHRPGYDRVKALAKFLLEFRDNDDLMSTKDGKKIADLWNGRPVRNQTKLTKRQFKARGAAPVVPGVKSARRHGRRSKDKERNVRETGAQAPRSNSLPPPKEKPHHLPPPSIQRPNTVGQAKMAAPVAQPTFVLLPVVAASTSASRSISARGFRSIRPMPPSWQGSAARRMSPTPPPPPEIPKSTRSYRKRKAECMGVQVREYKPRKGPTICSQCHQQRDSEHHNQYYGNWYCHRSQTQPLAEWRAMMSEQRLAKLKAKKE